MCVRRKNRTGDGRGKKEALNGQIDDFSST